MSQRPTHLTALVYLLVARFFPALARLRQHTANPLHPTLAPLEQVLAELLALAARLNPAQLRQAAFANPNTFRLPRARPQEPRPAATPRTPAPRATGTLTPHGIVTRIATLLAELDLLVEQLAPAIPQPLRDRCTAARAEAHRRLHPIRRIRRSKPPRPAYACRL